MKRIFYIFGFFMAFFAGGVYASELAPDVQVKNTAQEVLAIIKNDKDIQAGSQKKLLDLVEAKVLPHFDFKLMTQYAVGKSWRLATPAQQDALVDEFRTLLVRTYSTSLSAYKNQSIVYLPLRMQPGDTRVTVNTQIVRSSGQPIPIDYSLQKEANDWKIFDVVVDQVSLVTNYRGSFNSEIRQSGIDGLIKTLAEKNQVAAKK